MWGSFEALPVGHTGPRPAEKIGFTQFHPRKLRLRKVNSLPAIRREQMLPPPGRSAVPARRAVGEKWDRYFDESNGRFASYNQSRRLLERWQNPGDITDIPRHGVYTEFDSRLLEDASFLRLKNLMLSYSFPKSLLNKSRVLQGVRIYAQAQNLFTATKFSGLDPEGSTNLYAAQYPMARQYTFGVDITF